MARPADSLEQDAHRARRPYLTDKIDGPDIDAEFERRRSDAQLDLALLELPLGLMPPLVGHAPVVRDELLLTHLLRKLVGKPLHQPASVDEQQRRAVFAGQLDDAVERAVPQVMRRYRAKLILPRHLYREVDLASVAGIDDPAEKKRVLALAYRLSRAILGNRLADHYQYPQSSRMGTLFLFRMKQHGMRFLKEEDSIRASNFDQVLKISAYEDTGLSYKLPDHAKQSESSPW